MAEVIDILMPSRGDCPKFVADTTGPESVTITLPASPIVMQNASGDWVFTRGDNFEIISIGVVFPECFTLYKNPASMPHSAIRFSINAKGATDGELFFLKISSDSNVHLPMENFEFIHGIFVNTVITENIAPPMKYLSEQPFYIIIEPELIKISMLNVPSIYNGKTFAVVPFIKILHNTILYN